MRIKELDIDSLIPSEYNPRKALSPKDPAYEKISRSLNEFGLVSPLIVNEKNMHVIGGHQRLSVLKAQGEKTVMCILVDLDETREKALNLALNKVEGTWDEDKLLGVLDEIEDIALAGFDEADFEDLIARLYEQTLLTDDGFDTSETYPRIVQEKDIWTVGRHRLFVQTQLPQDLSADLLVATWLATTDRQAFSEAFLDAVSHLNKGASVYLFHDDELGVHARELFDEASLHLSGVCMYETNKAERPRSFARAHRPVLFGFSKGRHHWYADRKQTSVWQFEDARDDESLPLSVCGYALSNSSKKGDMLISLGDAAGETLLASELLDRTSLSVALDLKAADLALHRYVAATGDAAGITCERASYLELTERCRP